MTDQVGILASGGPSTAGLFELKSQAQYLFSTQGRCKLGRRSRIVTTLNNLSTGTRLEVAGADAGLGMEENCLVKSNGSLLLPPGLYSWISEIRAAPPDAIDEIAFRVTVSNSPEPIETHGLLEAFSVMSSQAGRKVFARGIIDAKIGNSEYLSAQLVVTDLSDGNNNPLPSPVLEMIGPSPDPVMTGVVPYVIKDNHVYRADLKIRYSGTGKVSCVLRQRWDNE